MDALEFGVCELPNPSNGFPQVSGLSFDLNEDINSAVKTDNGKFINVNGERRISNVKVNGEDLNLTKLYNVSLLEFIGNGGDGYSMFINYSAYNESIYTDTDSLIHYIKLNLKHQISEKYKQLQRRLSINDSQAIDEGNPKILIIGFNSYKYYENENLIKFKMIVSIINYSDEIDYLAIKLGLNTNNSVYEEKEAFCIKDQILHDRNIITFACSVEVNGQPSEVTLVDSSVIINGKPSNASTSETAENEGENIQNQTVNSFLRSKKSNITFNNCYVYVENNKLIFGGDNDNLAISSDDAILEFVQNETIKNIGCNISDEKNNTFKMICEPTFSINADFFGNNGIILIYSGKNVMMLFEEGKSFVNLEVGNRKNLEVFKTINKGEKSTGLIIFLIILFILLLVTIFLIVHCCKKLISINQKNDKNPPNSEVSPSLEISKNEVSIQYITQSESQNI